MFAGVLEIFYAGKRKVSRPPNWLEMLTVN
jgi:hypothetical protein